MIWSPPYNPAMQPIELFWRNSKQQVANEYRIGRNLNGVYEDLANYWFGCEESTKLKKKWPAFGSSKAVKLCLQAEASMDLWMEHHGVRCSRKVGLDSFKYDGAKGYGVGFDAVGAEAEAEELEEVEE